MALSRYMTQSVKSSNNHFRAISQEIFQPSIAEIRLEITYLSKIAFNTQGKKVLYILQNWAIGVLGKSLSLFLIKSLFESMLTYHEDLIYWYRIDAQWGL